MRTTTSRRALSLVIAVAVTLAMMAPMAFAAPVPSQSTSVTSATADEQAIAAERDLIKGKLMDFGLSDEDAASRVSLLTDEEVHAIAADLEAIQAAGATRDQQWDTLTVILLLILVAIIAD